MQSQKRMRIMVGIVIALLTTHFAIVYLKPGYLGLIRRSDLRRNRVGMRMPDHRVIEHEGSRWLAAGESMDDHFNIDRFDLDPNQLHYGIGREAFPALIEPTFVPAERADWMRPNHRVLLVKIGDETKIYPVDQLIRHEVVNDTVGGIPIFAAYCILADLGAVYDRRLDDQRALTFALSGYTYAAPDIWDGMDAFVLWDRDTESLWWPPIARAVSGPLIGTPLKLLDQARWSQTTYSRAINQFPEALVLEADQPFTPPTDWPAMQIDAPQTQPAQVAATQPATQLTAPPDTAIAPRWGDNSDL